MQKKEETEQLLLRILGISISEIQEPVILIPIFLQRVKKMLEIAKKHEQKLQVAGLSNLNLNEILMTMNLLENSELQLKEELQINKQLTRASQYWMSEKSELCKIKIELLCLMINKLNLSQENKKELDKILSYETDADIEQLEQVLILAQKLENELCLFNFNIEQINRAKYLIEKMDTEQNIAIEQSIQLNCSLLNRNKAYTYLKNQITILQEYAKKAFQYNSEKELEKIIKFDFDAY